MATAALKTQHAIRWLPFVAACAFLLLGLHAQGQATVTTNAATNVTDLAATLNGTVNPNGGGEQLYFEYGATTSYGLTAYPTPSGVSGSNAVPFSAASAGLQPATTYHFRALSYNSFAHVYTYGQDATFTTAAPNTPPTVGSVSVDTVPFATVVNVAGYGVNAGSSPATVSVEYGTTAAYGSVVTRATAIPTNWTETVVVRLANLTPGTLYHYRFKVINNEGIGYSSDATFTTKNAPTLTATVASGITDVSATLNGNAAANGGFYVLFVELGTTTTYGTTYGPDPGFVSGADSASLAVPVAGLFPNTVYHYRLKGLDSASEVFFGNDMTFTTGAPATPPTVDNVSALAVRATDAVLRVFSVFSGSSPTTVAFEYGTTTAYGFTATDATPVPTNSNSLRDVSINGLAPTTTYHFRCRATNGEGTVYSADQTFTTAAGPVAVTLAPAGVTDIAATLRGAVHTNSQTFATSFEYGLTNTYGDTIAATPSQVQSSSLVEVTAQPPGLQPDTTYHYRVKAVNTVDSSNVVYGADTTFTTGAPATPPTVADASAIDVTAVNARLIAATIQAGGAPATVRFEYGLTAAYGTTVHGSGTIPPNSGNATADVSIFGLTPATTYHFRCVVTNSQGSSATPDATFTTLTAPVVSTQPASGVADLAAVLNGTINSPGGAFWLSFELGTTTAYGTSVTSAPASLSAAGLTAVTGSPAQLLPATTYHYRFKAQYSSEPDIAFYGEDQTFTTAAAASPPTVGAVAASIITATTARVQAPAIQSGSSPATVAWEYGLTTAYGGTAFQEPAFPIPTNTTSASGVTLAGLLPQTVYHYRCVVTNSEGTSTSADATFTTLAAPIVTTAGATNVTDVTVTLTGSVNVNGTGSNRGLSLIGFELGTTTSYGRIAFANPFSVSGFNGTTQNVTSLPVAELLPNTTYHYRLRARDSAFVFFHGEDLTFTTGAPATPPVATTGAITKPSATGVTLTAYPLQSGSSPATLVFEYGPDTAYGLEAPYPGTFPTSTTNSAELALTGLTPSTTYHYRARVTNAEGTSYGADVAFTTPPLPTVTTGAVTNLQAAGATLNGFYDKQGGTYTVAIEYGTTTAYGSIANITGSGLGGIIIGLPPPSSGNHAATASPLSPETAYHYRIKLTDSYNNSYYGADATFTTPTPIGAWRQHHFGVTANTGDAADDASPAHDGIPNLVKYALSLDPIAPGALPTGVIKSYAGIDRLSLTFTRVIGNTDITYEVQVSDHPTGPWETIAASAAGAATTGAGFVSEDPSLFTWVNGQLAASTTSVEVRDTMSTADAPRRFMRLRITR